MTARNEINTSPDIKNGSAMLNVYDGDTRYKVTLDGIVSSKHGDVAPEELNRLRALLAKTGDPEKIQFLEARLTENK